MIDYKLILILVLSVVIYILYNKIEIIKNEVTKIKINLAEKTEDKQKYLNKFYEDSNEDNNEDLGKNINIEQLEKKDLSGTQNILDKEPLIENFEIKNNLENLNLMTKKYKNCFQHKVKIIQLIVQNMKIMAKHYIL